MAKEKVLFRYEFLIPNCPFKSMGVTEETLKKILWSGMVHLRISDFSVEMKDIWSHGTKDSGKIREPKKKEIK